MRERAGTTPRARATRVAARLLALALLLGACTGPGTERRRAQARGQGFEIVQSLEAYRARHGRYPDSLPELVPELLPRIEEPPLGAGRWSYRRVEGSAGAAPAAERFELAVPGTDPGAVALRFDWPAQRWVDGR